jgi:hypothetical protein
MSLTTEPKNYQSADSDLAASRANGLEQYLADKREKQCYYLAGMYILPIPSSILVTDLGLMLTTQKREILQGLLDKEEPWTGVAHIQTIVRPGPYANITDQDDASNILRSESPPVTITVETIFISSRHCYENDTLRPLTAPQSRKRDNWLNHNKCTYRTIPNIFNCSRKNCSKEDLSSGLTIPTFETKTGTSQIS